MITKNQMMRKNIKKVISREFIVDLNHIKELTSAKSRKYSSQVNFAKGWIEKFIDDYYKLEMSCP